MSTETTTNQMTNVDDISTSSSQSNNIVVQNNTTNEPINHNKPWRIIIRRTISDGGSENQGLS